MAWPVHLVHVLAMAVLVGGAAQAAWRGGGRGQETAWWVAYGLVVVTGVGNIGAIGDGLPGPEHPWGGVLLVKLVLVLVLGVLGLRRSAAAWRGVVTPGLWWLSSALAAVVASLGVWLAHG